MFCIKICSMNRGWLAKPGIVVSKCRCMPTSEETVSPAGVRIMATWLAVAGGQTPDERQRSNCQKDRASLALKRSLHECI